MEEGTREVPRAPERHNAAQLLDAGSTSRCWGSLLNWWNISPLVALLRMNFHWNFSVKHQKFSLQLLNMEEYEMLQTLAEYGFFL